MNFISIKIQYFQEKNKNRKQQFMNGISCSRNAGCRHFEQCLRCVSEFLLCVSVMDRMMAMPAENQLLFNLNPAVRPPSLPARFHPPQPIVINKFDAVSYFCYC